MKNDIDKFILAKLELFDQPPAPLAPSSKLLRRMSLDLIGLSPAAINKKTSYLTDNQTINEAFMDSLLASKHFGEKWATMWMYLAR